MRILVADDDLVSRLAMEDVLRQCGAPEIVLAEDGASAWRALTGEACFDLICLDVRMPPPDGLELVARLRAAPALKRVPAMLITSTADRNTVLSATRSDLQGFIVKPVGPDTVTRILRVLAQLDASILEPADAAIARLRVDTERHARYVGAFIQQIQALAGLAEELATATGGSQTRTAFVQKADACRTAALTLGSTRIEQLISDALALLVEGKPGASRAMAQAVYWLGRVSR
ncbi:response regulator [Scleromatobacter humisilvae]|uniref:Response regulator n=1 Tax=Scleromatobacter humisilvae TaxID=2897159 RepID=A0A9X1YLE6_9BURK|nr:response regulator [Scleromatobacter humisilvae]MCK9686527.1 response regulator [Scleromatobacter humisilvae]